MSPNIEPGQQYSKAELHRRDLDPNPIRQFQKWFEEAVSVGVAEPNAMTLATATRQGAPSARIVLLKSYDERGFTFHTNYQSQKGRELSENPKAALVFYWPALERQIRITGTVAPVSREESEEYFRSRPHASQIGAWASGQSEVLASRRDLEARFDQRAHEFEGKAVPRPPHWGGYRVYPLAIEFWQGRASRLHDRFRYSRVSEKEWRLERLAP